MKIVLFGNNRAAINVLRVMLARPSYEIRVVVPATRVVHEWHDSLYRYAHQAGIEAVYDAENINNPVFVEEMKAFHPDVFLSVYYDQIIGKDLLSVPRLACVNVHPSLLPEYKGVAPLIRVIANGESETGVTFHYMDESIDTGPVILQQSLDIMPDDTGYSLHMRCAELVTGMAETFFDRLERDQLEASEQSGPGSIYRKSDPVLNNIDWDDSAKKINNIIRALTKPLPGAYSWIKGLKCNLWSVDVVEKALVSEALKQGSICLMAGQRYPLIKASDHFIRLREVGVGGLQLSGDELVKRLQLVHGDHFDRGPEGLRETGDFDLASDVEVGQRYLPFGVPVIDQAMIDEVTDTLRSGWIGMGPKTRRFEQQFAEYTGAENAVAVSSCTAALHLSLCSQGIGPGDEVITTPMTFAATISAILLSGAKPVLADIDPLTLNISPAAMRHKLSSRTRALLPVHFGGLPCDMKAIDQLADEFKLTVIEDAAHAIGARYDGQPVGNRSNVACFSFYANKNMTTAEGGMMTTADGDLADRLRLMRLHGLEGQAWKRYLSKEIIYSHVVMPGYKYNMTDIQASLGIHQLLRLEQWQKTREYFAGLYDLAFSHLPGVQLQPRVIDGMSPGNIRHAIHLYVIMLDPRQFTIDRDTFVSRLREKNVGAAIHYPAIHQHPWFEKILDHKQGDFPVAEQVAGSILSLPLTPAMNEKEIRYIIDVVEMLHGDSWNGIEEQSQSPVV